MSAPTADLERTHWDAIHDQWADEHAERQARDDRLLEHAPAPAPAFPHGVNGARNGDAPKAGSSGAAPQGRVSRALAASPRLRCADSAGGERAATGRAPSPAEHDHDKAA